MFLVAGLAVAVIAGILAAFYFVRSGKRGGKRLRPAGAGRVGAASGRAGAVRHPSGRPGGAARSGQTEFSLRASGPARTTTSSRPAAARTTPLTESWPAAPSDPDDPQPGEPQPGDAWPRDGWPGDATAIDPGLRADHTNAARAGAAGPAWAEPGLDTFRDAKQRRRVGFRKGADIDEELWPAETFGGVSDEQFWDDMASDKPLATTARTAQQEAGPRSRLLDTGSAAASPGAQAPGARDGADQNRPDQARADRGRGDRGAGQGRRSAGYGAYPGPRTGPDPASAERTVVQPAYAATQPVKSMAPPAAAPPAAPPPPGQPRAASTPPAPPAPPSETARRPRPASTNEDPLTSASYSLRSRGPVDGRSSLRPRDQQDVPRSRHDAGSGAGRGPANPPPYGQAGPYPPAAPPAGPPAGTSYDDAASATQMMNTPAYGENYGYGGGSQADQADQPRRPGARSHARPGGTGERPQPPRPSFSPDTRQPSGSYPAGAYTGNGQQGRGHQPGGYQSSGGTQNGGQPGGGHQGGGHQGGVHQGGGSRGNGHRAPYDPRDDYQRLTHQR
ncbi:MAG: hypothetical protein ABSB59_38785 [Streptosporangiaceae bacterium]|jgi:hypothetical protein